MAVAVRRTVKNVTTVYRLPRRDSQRKRLYRAERNAFDSAFDVLLDRPDERGIQKVIRRVRRSKTWKSILREFNVTPYEGQFRVTLIKSQKKGASADSRDGLKFGTLMITLPVILHELAHVATGYVCGHSWPFANVYVRLVSRFIGRSARNDLRRAFRALKVRYTPPRSLSPERILALQDQGRRLSAQAALGRLDGVKALPTSPEARLAEPRLEQPGKRRRAWP
jgi:hypothetical protein